MKKKLIISENQYNRIFLLSQSTFTNVSNLHEQGSLSINDILDQSGYKGPSYGEMGINIATGAGEIVADKVYTYRHEIIDVLSIAVLVIPVAGLFISAGIDLAHAGFYYSEGEKGMAALMVGVAFIPGGIGAVKLLAGKSLTKSVNKVTQWILKEQKLGRVVTKEGFMKKIKQEVGEKTFAENKKIIDNYFTTIFKAADNPIIKKSFENVVKIAEKTSGYWKSFMSNGKVVQKFMKSNGDNIQKAYLSYLKSTATKEFLVAAGLYGIIMTYGTELATFAIDEVPGVKEGLDKWKIWRLENDAEAGNISSIVKLEGFDWNQTKEIFGSDGTGEDNILLKKAWKAGWRPFDKKKMVEITVPEEFHTEIYKEKYKEKLAYDISSQESLDRLENSAFFNDTNLTEGPLTDSTLYKTIDWSL